MDETKEGTVIIATSIVMLVAFAVAILSVMVIYRKRKTQHYREIALMNERFALELAQTQLEVQQQTMQEIGREIHDNVGQQLTLAYLYLQQFQAADQTGEHKRISTASIVNDSLTDLRNLSRSLTDSHRSIEKLTLQELITRACERIQDSGKLKVQVANFNSDARIAPAAKTFAFRIFQEFAQNSVRHSKGNLLTVGIIHENERTVLSVTDDGIGFTLHDKMQFGSGIENMKKRAEMIGAQLSLTSVPGQGTQLRLVIPNLV